MRDCRGDPGARVCAAGSGGRSGIAGADRSGGGANRTAARQADGNGAFGSGNDREAKQGNVLSERGVNSAMKKVFLSFLLLVVAAGLMAATAPRVSRGTLAAMEKSLDQTISNLWKDNQYLLLGSTRGVYLEGYGAVFTAEVNLVANPISLMSSRLSTADVARYRQTKLERVAVLKKTLTES